MTTLRDEARRKSRTSSRKAFGTADHIATSGMTTSFPSVRKSRRSWPQVASLWDEPGATKWSVVKFIGGPDILSNESPVDNPTNTNISKGSQHSAWNTY